VRPDMTWSLNGSGDEFSRIADGSDPVVGGIEGVRAVLCWTRRTWINLRGRSFEVPVEDSSRRSQQLLDIAFTQVNTVKSGCASVGPK
jgi:hypothetical protein